MKEKWLYIAVELSMAAICAAVLMGLVFSLFTPEGVEFIRYWSQP